MDQCITKMEDWQLVRKDGEIYHLPFGMSFIGREECDITLQSHSVDKRHAVIFYDSSDKEVRIKDLNSLTGTHVNSVRIPEQSYVKLKHLDCIRFGYGPDLFYIQKLDTKQSTVSPKKEILEPSTVCHNSNTTAAHFEETTKDNIESKHFLIEQDKSRESELYSSIHEADSLEDIKQSVSENSSTSPSLAISEKVPIVDKSLKTKFLEDKGNMYCALEQNLNAQTSQEIESMDDGKEKKLPFEGKQKISQQIKEELPALEMQILQLYNGKNEEGNQKVSNKDSEQANSESSPVAMAFTIAFDSDLTASRKKLGIKDSISQYAPRKTEPERSPIQKLRPGKLNESNSKKALSLDMKDITLSAPDISKKWIQENAKQSLLSQSTESTLWDLASKREHKEKVSSEGKLSEAATFLIQKMLNGEQKIYNSSSSNTAIESSPRMTNWSQNWNKKNQLDGIIKSPTKVSSECRIKSPDDGSVLQKEIDDKSETGTYTVETDLNDPAVDEARQKIDEIFGIHKNIEKLQASNLNSEEKEKQHSVANEQSKCLVKPVTPITLISQQGNEISYLEKSHPKTKTEKNARPKRRLPTPPIPKQLDASISDSSVDSSSNNVTRLGHYPLSLIKKEKKHQSSHSNNQDSICDSYSKQSSGSLQNTTSFYISSDTSDRRSKFLENVQSQKLQKSLGLTSSTIVPSSHISLDSCDSQTKSNIAQQENCQNGDDDSLDGTTLLHYVPSDTRSEGSPQAKTPQNGSGLWRRIPWNLSNSDLELNRSKSETASVVSDLSTSTEPSSLSSQYSKGKSDSAPPMRLNRAFALRRARLGIESDSATTVVSKKGGKENIKQQSSSNKISSHLNPQQLSRQDGGRFSLRLPRKCTTKSNEKSASKSKDSKRNSAASNKNGHRRIESDPGKANIHWKKMDIINDTVNSDVEIIEAPIISSPYNKLQSFHRSASFNGAEELLFEKDNLNDSSKKLERPNKLVKSSAISKLRKQSGLGTTKALGISPGWQHSSFEEKGSEKLSQGKSSPQQQNSSKKELSALDSLVISAIHQLSIKLRTRARCLLEKEGQKYSEKSDIRLMIEEVLPQVVEKKSNIHNEGNLTRDLSSILKNLKRVEQSLEVLSSLADYDTQIKGEQNQTETQKFFVVDV